jgi:K+-transporting ATPase KdpF subunit
VSEGNTDPSLAVGIAMEFLVVGVIAFGLLIYLAYAMFNPEKF